MANGNGSRTIFAGMAGVALLSYLGWIGLTVMEIRDTRIAEDRILKMEATVEFLKERQDQRAMMVEQTLERLDHLETAVYGRVHWEIQPKAQP